MAFTIFCFNVPPSTEPESESHKNGGHFRAFGEPISDVVLNRIEEFCNSTNGFFVVAEFPRSAHFDVQAVKRD
jgi:hypothetical protein